MNNQCSRGARGSPTGWTSNVFTFPEGVRVTHIGGEEAPRSPGGTLIGPYREASRDPNANIPTISRAQKQAQRLIENQVRKYKAKSPERDYERSYGCGLDDSFDNPSSPVSYVPYYAPPTRRNETYEEMIARRLKEVGETSSCKEESPEDELAKHAELAAEAARKAQIHSQKTNKNTELAICHATQAAEMFEEIQRQREQEECAEQVCPEPTPEEYCEPLEGRFKIPSPCPPVVITAPPCPCPEPAPVIITSPPCPTRTSKQTCPPVCKVDSPMTANKKKCAQRVKEFKLKQLKNVTESKLLRPSRQPSTISSASRQTLSRTASSRKPKAQPPPCVVVPPTPQIPEDECAVSDEPESPTTAKMKKLLQSMADFDKRFKKMPDLIPRPNRPPSTFTTEPPPCPSTTSAYKSKALNVGSRRPLNVPSTRAERPPTASGVPSYMQSTKAAANRVASVTRQSTIARTSRIPKQGDVPSATASRAMTASRLNTATSRLMAPSVNRTDSCKPIPPVTASRTTTQRRNFAAPTESTIRRATSKKTTTCKQR